MNRLQIWTFILTLSSFANAAQTVGDMLKNADRGGGLKSQGKQNTALPAMGPEPVPVRKKSNVDLGSVKPPRTSPFYNREGGDQAELERITDEQIKELFKLTERFKNAPQRGELWLRLGELYVEKAAIIDFRKQAQFDVKLKNFQEGKTKIRPILDLRDAHEYNRRALQLYEWFIRDFPNDRKVDQALFFLGYNSYELGELKKGTYYYDRLTKEHPQSAFVVESNFALAEYYFENEKWKLAQEHYAHVVAHPHHRLYGFALYKTAWCYFRTGHSNEALKTMENLIRTSQFDGDAATRKNMAKNRLEGEGLRDIVLFYAEVGDPSKAPEYFKNLAGAEYLPYIEKLSYYYADKGMIEAARIEFHYLIGQNPANPKAFDYKYQVVQLLTTTKNSKEFRDELFSWIHDYGPGGDWSRANAANKELIENSNKLREATLRTYVLQNHQTAQNSHAPYSEKLADDGYKVYLREFPQAALIGDMHFYYGELLYDMKRYDDAGEQYRWVAENAPKSKFYTKAGENIVLSLEKDVPRDEEIAARVGKSLDPVEFDPRIDKFVKSALWYMGKYPQSEKIPEMKFRVGRLYYQHNQFDKAIAYFRDILQKHPNTKYAEYSANLLLDIFNLKKDYAGLEKVGAEILAIKAIANSPTGVEVRSVIEKSQFKKGQDLETSKDYLGAGNQYSQFAAQHPTSALATTAHFNAAINYERANANGQAIAEHVAVLKSHDASAENFKNKSQRIVGKLYQDAGMLEEAAKSYEVTAAQLKKDPLVPNLLFNAGILYEALGENEKAMHDLKKSVDLSHGQEKLDTIFQLAELSRKSGSHKQAIDYYTQYYSGGGNSEHVVESAYYIYKLQLARNHKTESDEWQKKTLATQRRLAPEKAGIGAHFAAEIKLQEAIEKFNELKSIRIPANPQKQQEAAQKKIEFLKELNRELANVIKFDSPEEIVGALSILGQSNLHMGKAFVEAPIPAGLNADETKKYKDGVEKLAEPFFAKARESLKAAVDKSSELEAYNSYSRTARTLLAQLDKDANAYSGVPVETKFTSWGDL